MATKRIRAINSHAYTPVRTSTPIKEKSMNKPSPSTAAVLAAFAARLPPEAQKVIRAAAQKAAAATLDNRLTDFIAGLDETAQADLVDAIAKSGAPDLAAALSEALDLEADDDDAPPGAGAGEPSPIAARSLGRGLQGKELAEFRAAMGTTRATSSGKATPIAGGFRFPTLTPAEARAALAKGSR